MPAPTTHAADAHDLIRVHGARENNLKNVDVELPKRRLTVFTGVSGSGKSSLVFGTIAAESSRMINETYSTFIQAFMNTPPRPDVDVRVTNGRLRRNAKGFAFVDDGFVSPSLIEGIPADVDDVTAVLVYAKHPKEEKYAWRAVSISTR